MHPWNRWAYIAAWVIALVGTLGSLYFSEVENLTPCLLCWYQRIAMYPLALLFPVGLLRKDRFVGWYALPLTVIGAGLALFHYLLQMGVIPDSAGPCQLGVSCTDRYVEWFGFVTIPLLSLLGFCAIIALTIFALRNTKRTNHETPS